MRTNQKSTTGVDVSKSIVLVVDDNPANLEIIANYLQDQGLEAAIAGNGEIALKRVKHLQPDLILLDVLMPGIDGFETCRKLKADEDTRDIPVIFMTSLTDSEYRTQGFRVGGVDYIAKPIHYEEMYARVKTHLEIRQYRERLEEKVLQRTEELHRRTRDLESANQQLKRHRHTFMTVLDSIDAAVYVSDLKTYEILFMNRYLKDLMGADHTGQTCWRVFHDAEAPCDVCINHQLHDARGAAADVISREQKDLKTNRWFMKSDRAIEWIDGRQVHIHVAMDITKVKELEKERLQTEILLAQSQKMEAIGTLAGGIAHDFNNILSPIMGYVEMIIFDMGEDNPYRDRLHKVLTASNRARDLVMQILNFSRQSDHDPRPFRVQTILKEVLKLMKATLPATIEIRQDIDEYCSAVVADPGKVHQIAMNLVTNAYHAMEDNGGTLSVVLEERTLNTMDVAVLPIDEGAYVCMSVSDTGMGMEKTTMDRIFDPYFTTKETGKGTGLGLAVVNNIVNHCGGAVSVDSTPGKGSRFSVFLPAKKQATEKELRWDGREIKGGSEFLLIVDDEPEVAEVHKQILESLGYGVTARTDSMDTLALFREDPDRYDLLITDLTMPRMTGDKLTREITRIRPDMPVIICTGFSEKIDAEKIKAFGARDLVMKPFVKKEFAQTIRRVLDEA